MLSCQKNSEFDDDDYGFVKLFSIHGTSYLFQVVGKKFSLIVSAINPSTALTTRIMPVLLVTSPISGVKIIPI